MRTSTFLLMLLGILAACETTNPTFSGADQDKGQCAPLDLDRTLVDWRPIGPLPEKTETCTSKNLRTEEVVFRNLKTNSFVAVLQLFNQSTAVPIKSMLHRLKGHIQTEYPIASVEKMRMTGGKLGGIRYFETSISDTECVVFMASELDPFRENSKGRGVLTFITGMFCEKAGTEAALTKIRQLRLRS